MVKYIHLFLLLLPTMHFGMQHEKAVCKGKIYIPVRRECIETLTNLINYFPKSSDNQLPKLLRFSDKATGFDLYITYQAKRIIHYLQNGTLDTRNKKKTPNCRNTLLHLVTQLAVDLNRGMRESKITIVPPIGHNLLVDTLSLIGRLTESTTQKKALTKKNKNTYNLIQHTPVTIAHHFFKEAPQVWDYFIEKEFDLLLPKEESSKEESDESDSEHDLELEALLDNESDDDSELDSDDLALNALFDNVNFVQTTQIEVQG